MMGFLIIDVHGYDFPIRVIVVNHEQCTENLDLLNLARMTQ